MKLSVILTLAFKNLWSHKMRTILTIIGVTIGVGAIIFLVSLGYGLERLVTSQVADFNAFTIIDVTSSNSKKLRINDKLVEDIQALGHVEQIAREANIAGRMSKTDADSTAETVVIAGDNNYYSLSDLNINEGLLPQKKDEVILNDSALKIIGEDAENLLGKKISLKLIIPEDLLAEGFTTSEAAEKNELKVVGVFNYSDSPVVFARSELLQDNGLKNYSALKVKLNNAENIPSTREEIEAMGYNTEYVGDTLDEIGRVFSLFRLVLAAFGFIALIVAALGTFNTLTISLLERVGEVGLFKSIGMRNKDVYKLFLAEALIIGGFGGIVGAGFGTLIGYFIHMLVTYAAKNSGAEHISLFVTPWSFAVAVAVFSIIVGFLTGWYPSKRAVKIDPLDALRYE